MYLIRPVDEKATIANVKKVLRQYPRLREVACDSEEQNITQVLTFMPRTGGKSDPVAALAVRRVDAIAKLEEIEQAVSRLYNPNHRHILVYKYLKFPTLRNDEVAMSLHVEKTVFQEMHNRALLAFAEQYRDSALVVEVKE